MTKGRKNHKQDKNHIHWVNNDSNFINYDAYKKDFLEKIKDENILVANSDFSGLKTSISKKIKKRKEEIENDALEQDIKLKKITLFALFIFLGIETLLIFLFSFLQATHLVDFRLEEWSFKLLVAATISQITYMVQVAVKHLFPNK
jgi:hypothetical protein